MLRKYTWRYSMIIFVSLSWIFLSFLTDESSNNNRIVQKDQNSFGNKEVTSYLINTSQCKIPDSDPYSEEIIKFLSVEEYSRCSEKDLLTYINKSNGIVTLNVNQTLLKQYSSLEIKCCYSNITRINYEKNVDNQIKLTECTPFHEFVEIKFPYIKVECSNFFRRVYANVHAVTLPVSTQVKSSPTDFKYSVLLLGIDSMSNSNLKRTMKKTHDYVEENMIYLKGYNKIGDNTFPNLMAMFTPYSMSELTTVCDKNKKVNYCNIIWDTFKKSGYVTAYAENSCAIGTYHFARLGFSEEPTDYYYYPYFLAAEDVSITWRGRMTYCAGPETSGERILNAAKDFSTTHKDVPYFGVFWSNSHSHDNVNMPATMDEPYLKLFSDPEFLSSLNNTILFFFSDHGFRFGNIRYTHTGWLEERLPFMYIRIPDGFKRDFPEKYNNLLINSDRLTTPYDVFNSFQDILTLGNDSYVPSRSNGCPSCHSLFLEITENRTCQDASIEQHWCTCRGHNYINPDDPKVKVVSEFVISKINNILKSFSEGSLCLTYTLRTIRVAGVSEPQLNEDNEYIRYFLVMIDTDPTATFEATVEVMDRNNHCKLLGEISRLDRYESVSGCITSNSFLKKYCYCSGIFYKINSLLDTFRE